MKVLFMGTPDFAVFSLKELYNSGFEIVGAVTKEDTPKGRGYVLTPPPVKEFAMSVGIPVFQPKTLRDDDFQKLLEKLNPDVIAVVAFGKILPKNVLDYPKYGCINVHGSLLPKYRGAAPMQRAIIDGEKYTGITTMYMAEGLDTGDMLLLEKLEIDENDNFETIHDKLGEIGAKLLVKTLNLLEKSEVKPIKQDDSQSNYAQKITKEECLLDFSLDAITIHNKIRGLSPFPLSYTHQKDGKLLKIVKSEIADRETKFDEYGKVLSFDGGKIKVSCKVGAINILSVLPEGKGRMSSADFINGRKIEVGDILK